MYRTRLHPEDRTAAERDQRRQVRVISVRHDDIGPQKKGWGAKHEQEIIFI